MDSFRLPELGRKPGRGFPIPRGLLGVASVLGVAALWGAALTLPSVAAEAVSAVGTVYAVARVRVEAGSTEFRGWPVGTVVPLRWRGVGRDTWIEGRGRVVAADGEAPAFVLEWIAGGSGQISSPPVGVRVEIEVGSGEAGLPKAWWRVALNRLRR